MKGYRHCISVDVDAPSDAMWKVISEIGDIARFTPSLKRSEVLDGRAPGVGAVRRCEDRAGRCWSEDIIEFERGRALVMRFRSEEPDFQFPAVSMVGGWEVEAAEDGSIVRVWWELEPKPAYLAPLLLGMFAFQVDRTFPPIIRRMAADAVESESAGAVATRSRSLARHPSGSR